MDEASVEPGTGTEIVRAEVIPAPTLFGAPDPEQVIERASAHATALAKVIEQRDLFKQIGPKRYVFVEGWTLLGSMVGVFPVEVSTTPEPVNWRALGLERPEGFIAVVEARTRDGGVVGRANSRCMRSEKRWADADEYAIASMAQTRATSKALRMPLGFIVVLAGFTATPAEELDGQQPDDSWDNATPAEGGKRQTRKPAAKSTAKKPAASKAKDAKAAPAKKGDEPASRATWDEAVALIGERGKVVEAYRATFDVKGSVAIRDVTETKLRKVIDLARKAKGES